VSWNSQVQNDWAIHLFCLSHPVFGDLIPSQLMGFFGGIRLWTQGLALTKQSHYNLSHTISPFFAWLSFEKSYASVQV
jgi:hypothetical protein